MAQAFASAAGSTCALRHGFGSVVQLPSRSLYRDCTSYSSDDLAEATTTSLFEELSRRGGNLTPEPVATALAGLVATMVAMAEGAAAPSFFLSSLDPGVGKTTSLIKFVQHLLRSEPYSEVSALLCFSQLDEIARLVEDMGLHKSDFAVFTSRGEINDLSSTPRSEARILFTTQEMVRRRCRNRSFKDVKDFYCRGKPRAVRVWDEALLPGEVVSITTDQLASLRGPLRCPHPALAELIDTLEGDLKSADHQDVFSWPDVAEAAGTSLWSATRSLKNATLATPLETLYDLSGRPVRLHKSQFITALDSRDVIPDDLAPVVILDASGRVRTSYKLWEEQKGNLVHLPPATKSYDTLTIHVMNRGSGKSTWEQKGEELAKEVAHLIDSKPAEDWLVIYHKGANNDTTPDLIRGLLGTNPDRVSFLNWGRHHGTNAHRKVRNVILAGLNNYAERDYEMLARYYGGVKNDEMVPKGLLDEVRAGEHQHHILQALCRSSVRQCNSSDSGPCHAYIIAPKRVGILDFLPVVFPGCKVKPWMPAKAKATGKVQQALIYVEMHFLDYPDEPLRFSELQSELEITSSSNFRRTIRNHDSFKAGLDALDIEEATVGHYRHRNAFSKKQQCFGPVEGSSYIADV